MTFKKLAEYFLKLEQTASRNEMVVILARLLSEVEVNEIDKVVYLTQGRVAPLYEPVEFQMAEKMVIRAMAMAYDSSVEEVTKLYKKSGDLGVTAEAMVSSWSPAPGGAIGSSKKDSISRSAPSRMTVQGIFEKLTELTKISGAGSVDIKVKLISEILKDCDGVSARIIARIPVDKLRLGFSDMTVLEALSWMVCGTKKLKDEFETAYNCRPDLGFIAKMVKQNKLKVEPAVGTPILGMRAERLTSPEAILEKMGGNCAVEPKLDGLRTQLHFSRGTPAKAGVPLIKLYSRGLENVTKMYPDLVRAAQEELDCDEVILDGEAIGFDPKTNNYLPFQETVQRKRKHQIGLFAENVPLKLIVFDVLFLNGKSLINETYETRRKVLETLLGHSGGRRPIESSKKADPIASLQDDAQKIILAEMEIITNPERLDNYFGQCVKKGLEGIMAKKLDGVYQAGARGFNWIKYKKSYSASLADTVDAVVMGIDFGQGKRNKFGVGAFLIGVFDPRSQTYKTISKVGTGLTDDEWRELKAQSIRHKAQGKPQEYDVNKLNDCDVWMTPKLVGEFKADELTKSPMHTAGYALRFPRLVRWREKKPEDTTNLDEIRKLAG